MDDVTIKIRAQYVERIIWMVIILILLTALIVVYFKKGSTADQGTIEDVVSEDASGDEQVQEPPPKSIDTGSQVITPPPSGDSGGGTTLSGSVGVQITDVSCTFTQETVKTKNTNTSANVTYTTMKLVGLTVVVDNQKKEMTVYANIYFWDKKTEELNALTVTKGTRPLLLGTIKAGEKLTRDIKSTEIPTTRRQDPDTLQNLKVDIVDDKGKVITSSQRRFTVQDKQCKL